MKELVFTSKKDEYNWKRDKLRLATPHKYKGDIYYNIEDKKFYRWIEHNKFAEIEESQLPICYGYPAKYTMVVLGNGRIDEFAHFTRESNGYPECPWEHSRYDKVYVVPEIEIEAFWRCTFSFYDKDEKKRYEPSFIKMKMTNLDNLIDMDYIYLKDTYTKDICKLK